MTVKKQARNDKRKQKKCCGMTGREKMLRYDRKKKNEG